MENFYKDEELDNQTTSAQENATGTQPEEIRDENQTTNLVQEPVEALEMNANEPENAVKESISEVHEINEITDLSSEIAHDAVIESNHNEHEATNHSMVSDEVHAETQENSVNILPEIEPIHSEEEADSSHEPLVEEDVIEELEGLGKTELLKIVEEAIHFPESRKMNIKVQNARNEFFKILDDERREEKEKFTSDVANEGKEFVAPHDPMVKDFNQAFKQFKIKRKEYIDDLNKQKELNLQLKKEVLDKLKELIEGAETQTSFTEIKKLQEEWKKIGPVPMTDAEKQWTAYNFYVNKFYDQFSLYSEFKDLDRKRNLTAKEEIITNIEKLNSIEDLNEAMRLLRPLTEDWRHIGPVPRESMDDVINRYKNAVIQLYDKREKINEELQNRRIQNYDAKVEILEKLKEITEFHSEKVQEWMDKNVEMGAWIEKWRGIGSVPMEKRDELKDQLNEVIRKFNKVKNDFFRDRKREKVDNLKKKTELCEKAEEILTLEDIGSHRKTIIQMQEDWKKIGPVLPKFSEVVWKRFHTACDSYFKKLSEQFGERDKEQHENLAKKKVVIEKIETLSKQENIENLEETVKGLQEEFDAIGFVPFKAKDEVRKAFYKAMGLLANKGVKSKGKYSKANEMVSYKLMLESWTQDADGSSRVGREERRIQQDLKKIENEVAILDNNMQFLSNSKTADALKSNLESQINKLKVKMTELKEKHKIARQIAMSSSR